MCVEEEQRQEEAQKEKQEEGSDREEEQKIAPKSNRANQPWISYLICLASTQM